MRKLGVCTWTFGPIALPEVASKLQRLGFDGLELHGDLGFKPAEVQQILSDHGLEVFSLTPANVDLAHPDSGVRVKALEYYLRLVDFAAELGCPLVCCHGDVGRIAPLAPMEQEWDWLVENTATVCDHAATAGTALVFEVLNRYESHLVNTAAEALFLLRQVGRPNLKVLLDAYHMNIEEPDLAGAILETDQNLGLFHVADSNRQGLGYGHIRFPELIKALYAVAYSGPIVVEATAAGPNPFTPVKGEHYLEVLQQYLSDSLAWLRTAE